MTSCRSVWLATTGPDSPDRARVATGTKRDRSWSHIITETRCAGGIVCSSSSTMKVSRPRSSNMSAVILERLSSRRERRAAPMTVWSPADACAAASADTRRRISESPASVCTAATCVARRAAVSLPAAASVNVQRTEPILSESPLASVTRCCEMRRPLTNVPLKLPRSCTPHAPSFQSTSAWRRETLASVSATPTAAPRPMVMTLD